MATLVGHITISKDDQREQYGEYAADYSTVDLKPGKYQVHKYHQGLMNQWSCPATIVSGSWWNKKKPGDVSTYCGMIYDYNLDKCPNFSRV